MESNFQTTQGHRSDTGGGEMRLHADSRPEGKQGRACGEAWAASGGQVWAGLGPLLARAVAGTTGPSRGDLESVISS